MSSGRGFELVRDCQRAVVYTIVQVLVNSENIEPNVIKLLRVFQHSTGHFRADVCNIFIFFFALKEASIV